MSSGTFASEQRTPAAHRTNRALLTLLGLLLLLAGVATVLVGLGVFGSARADTPVLAEQVTDFADQNRYWFWPLVAVVAVILGLLALRWLVTQARTSSVAALDLNPEREPGPQEPGNDRGTGRTRLSADALTGAVTDELESYRGVSAATTRLVGSHAAPRLSVRVRLDGRVHPGEIRRRVEHEALQHARSALSGDPVPLRLELVVPRVPTAAPEPGPAQRAPERAPEPADEEPAQAPPR